MEKALSPFQLQVFEAAKLIPFGQVATYQDIANLIGQPKAARAVGNALHINPTMFIVPCHRVVNSQGGLALHFGFNGVDGHRQLLSEEGVEVIDDHVDLSRYQVKHFLDPHSLAITMQKALNLAKAVHHDDASGHDFSHIMRVKNMALHLSSFYGNNVNLEVIFFASVLHDIEDPKLSVKPKYFVSDFLGENGISQTIQTHILEIIRNMSYSSSVKGKRVSTLEGQIVQDADRLDAIGAIGISRAFAYGGFKNRLIEGSEKTTIYHFSEKLLKLKDLMNTPEAKRIAESRHRYIVEFLKQYQKEKAIED